MTRIRRFNFIRKFWSFIKKSEIPMGGAKWLTVVSSEGGEVELLLEPDWNEKIQINGKPAAKEFKKALFNAEIPFTSFGVNDVQEEYERLEKLGVKFTMKPAKMGPVTLAVFDDSCGNLIQIAQKV